MRFLIWFFTLRHWRCQCNQHYMPVHRSFCRLDGSKGWFYVERG